MIKPLSVLMLLLWAVALHAACVTDYGASPVSRSSSPVGGSPHSL